MSVPFTSPAPWSVNANGGARTIVARDRSVVAVIVGSNGAAPFEVGNGALMAAAPLLVEELRATLIALPNHSTDCQGKSVAGAACCFYAERHRNARAALAKAEAR